MELNEAIQLLRNAVKHAANKDKHLDLTLVAANERPKYEKALVVSQLCIKEGKITKDEFMRQIHMGR